MHLARERRRRRTAAPAEEDELLAAGSALPVLRPVHHAFVSGSEQDPDSVIRSFGVGIERLLPVAGRRIAPTWGRSQGPCLRAVALLSRLAEAVAQTGVVRVV
jgi:hypothetical protein